MLWKKLIIPALRRLEAGGSRVRGQARLLSEFQASLTYTVRHCLKAMRKVYLRNYVL
jgi:hypothetical protein